MPTPDASFLRELGGPLLASVSRSFYLSLRFLPRALRAPISLAYLLARASDTIADESAVPVETRLGHLEDFARAVEHGPNYEALRALRRDVVPAHPGERVLIEKIPRCLEWLAAMPATDRAEIAAVLSKIIRGQTLDLRRFADPTRLEALRTAADLDEYTYLVAGCVGEFWTRLCLVHLRDYSSVAIGELCALGAHFGQGLQLVNILRDLPADLKAGRCYLPASELADLGLTPADLLLAPRDGRPILQRWLRVAAGHLADAALYIENIRTLRVRFACILPWYLGMRTLSLCARVSPLESSRRLKVPRSEVYPAILLAKFSAVFPVVFREVRRERESALSRHLPAC